MSLSASASAATAYEVGIADDRLLFSGDAEAAATATEWRSSGVDVVRVFARWGAVAPAPDATTPPAGFDPRDPAGYDWRTIDRAVDAVTSHDMKVILTVTGWGPVWGSEFPGQRNPRWKPSPSKFADFATAVAKRYGDRVDRYIVWNEPNVALWMQPQSTCSTGGKCTPYAPHQYRRLVRAAEPALRAADPGARVMLGALAPRGTNATSTNANLRPLAFLRAMGCVDARYRRIRTGACSGFAAATGDLLAYHPHGLKLSPSTKDPVADQAHLADLGEVTSAVDRIVKAGGLRVRGATRFPLYLDEYAYQTSPPDRVLGVSKTAQASYLAQSAYLAWANPRVRGLAWYVWRDEPLAGGSGGWQSGMRYVDGSAKPALAAFPRPFWAQPRTLWGQVRPGERHTVTLERRSGTTWRAVATIGTGADGAFRRTVGSAGTYRFRSDAGTSAARTVE